MIIACAGQQALYAVFEVLSAIPQCISYGAENYGKNRV